MFNFVNSVSGGFAASIVTLGYAAANILIAI